MLYAGGENRRGVDLLRLVMDPEQPSSGNLESGDTGSVAFRLVFPDDRPGNYEELARFPVSLDPVEPASSTARLNPLNDYSR